MTKSLVTQELANAFPEWARIRSDEQSVGYALLNVIGNSLEDLVTELFRGYKNLFLCSANVGELDLTYRVQLPESYNFSLERSDTLQPLPLAPTVTGFIDPTWYSVTEVSTGSVKDFWYNAVPTRTSVGETLSGITNTLVNSSTTAESVTPNATLFNPNQVFVEVSAGTQFFDTTLAELPRARVRITGVTWTGLDATEDMVFLFNSTRPSNKVWASISKVEFIDFIEEATVKIYAAPLALTEYLDPFEDMQQQKDSRSNMPVFWRIGTTEDDVSYLEQARYRAKSNLELLQNQTDLLNIRAWELLDEDEVNIVPIDIALVPFQQKVWVLTSTHLHLFDTEMNMPDIQTLTERTVAPATKIETSSDTVLREEDLEINLVNLRPIKTIIKYQFSILYPDETRLYLDGDDLVATSTWVSDIYDDRLLRTSIILGFSDLGQHDLRLEVQYQDGTIEVDERAILVDSKTELFSVAHGVTSPTGVYIDHLNKLWVTTATTAKEITPHYDIMLVDYNNKQLIFREPYSEVKVVLDGS